MSRLFVALGGSLGEMLRLFVCQPMAFPFGTKGANIIGSFANRIALVTIGAKVGSKEGFFNDMCSGWLYHIFHFLVGRIHALGGG